MKNLTITTLPIEALTPYARNTRLHSKNQINKIAKSIQAFGFITPVLIDEDNNLIAGHGRALAAQQLKLIDIPCVTITHLSDDQIKAYRIADNRIALDSSWDNDLLKVELSCLIEHEVNIDLTGFETPELDLLLLADAVDDDTAHNIIPAFDVSIGDLWALGDHRLLCGDAIDSSGYKKLLGDTVVDMLFSDPPYNVPIKGFVSGNGEVVHKNFAMAAGEMSEDDFIAFLHESLTLSSEYMAADSIAYLFMDWRHLHNLIEVGSSVFDRYLNLCVWDKGRGGMGSFYRSQHEMIAIFSKGKHQNNIALGKYGRNRTNVWSYPGVSSLKQEDRELLHAHPTVKPLTLLSDAILDCTKRGAVILDPFLGSGSTLLAAEQVGRVAYGIEIDPHYASVALTRFEQMTGITPIKLND